MTLPSAKKLLMCSAPYVQQTTDTLPAMTDNNLPAGHVASAGGGTETFGTPPWRAFNKQDSSVFDFALQDPKTGWVQRRTPAPIRVWRFGIRGRTGAVDQCPRDFALYGSNDGSNFVLLRAVTGQINWTDYQERFFEIDRNRRAAFLIHRLVLTENNGSPAMSLNEIYLHQEVRR